MLRDIIGQPYAVQVIRNYLADNHVSGSFLFVGPQHVGKTTTARQFAKAMLCDDPQPGLDCCDTCISCRSIDSGKHPDVRSARPAGPSRILRIAQIWPRDGVKDFPPESSLLHDLHFAPVTGKRRIFIIEDADALNEDTANSLLKALEEPPRYATFILTAPSISSVLPTIFSRCQTIRFQSVPPADIEMALSSLPDVDASVAAFVAAFAQGQLGTALDIAADPDLRTARDVILNSALQLSTSRAPIEALKIADDFRKAAGKLGINRRDSGSSEPSARQASVAALELLAFWYRDLLSIAADPQTSNIVNMDYSANLGEIAAQFDVETLVQAIGLITDIRHCVERNANGQIAFEALALKLITMRLQEAVAY